jgi:hypothetical protein
LRRGPDQVQVGVDATRAVVLDGLGDTEVAALRLLDGTRPVPEALAAGTGAAALAVLRAEGLLADAAEQVGLPPQVRALLEEDAQALLRVSSSPARGYAALAARRAARVLVVGRGPLPTGVAALLRRAGVGEVGQGTWAGDDWEQARATHESVAEPALAVLTAADALDPRESTAYWRHGIPVLPVVLAPTEALVGPLVRRPRAGEATGPCLHCLDQTRADLDPAWPALLEQLTRPAVGRATDVGGDTALVAMAAAMAAMVALAAVDGQPLPTGRSLEVQLPWPGVRQREWPVHPRCECNGARVDARSVGTDASGQPADGAATRQVRMAG